jgi:hypothetical protein
MINLDQYTETLIPLAMRLVATIRDEGPAEVAGVLAALRALPAPDGTDPADAIAVVLAAAIDPDTTADRLWGWTRQFGGPTATVPTGPAANALAVEMAVAGVLPLRALNEDEQTRAVDTLIVTRQWTAAAVAAHLDAEPEDIRRIRHNSKRRNYRASREDAA